MEQTSVQKLARALRVLVLIVFVCNLMTLLLVPGLSALVLDRGSQSVLRTLLGILSGEEGLALASPGLFFLCSWVGVWSGPESLLAMFLLVGGTCTAIILWQGKRVLDTVLAGEPFALGNAANLRRAAVCSFVIFGAAAVFGSVGIWYFSILWGGLDYNARGASVFVVLYLIGVLFLLVGLLFLVMSALFRQAAEMKAEQDLTI